MEQLTHTGPQGHLKLFLERVSVFFLLLVMLLLLSSQAHLAHYGLTREKMQTKDFGSAAESKQAPNRYPGQRAFTSDAAVAKPMLVCSGGKVMHAPWFIHHCSSLIWMQECSITMGVFVLVISFIS